MSQETCTRVILFDGVCNLCDRSVQFVLRRDPGARFRFASLQSEVAGRLLADAGMEGHGLSGVVFIDGDRVFTKSDAALRIARRLGGIWPLASVFWILPAALRNRVYDWVARNRYRWFGKRDSCAMPSPEVRGRFLDWNENQTPTDTEREESPGS